MKADDCAAAGDFGVAAALARVVVTPREGTPHATCFHRGQRIFRKVRRAWKSARRIWTDKPACRVAPPFGGDQLYPP